MEDTYPDFPPLTARQRFLLDEIKSLKEELEALPPWDPKTGTWVPEFYEIQKKIDDLSVKALRSGLLRGLPAESRRPGFLLVFDSTGEYAKVLPGAGDFHPELPPWAENHFVEWLQIQRLRKEGRETLRETKVVGLETGMKRPKDFSEIECWELIRRRVLELRGTKDEENEVNEVDDDDDMSPAMANESPPYTLAEIQEELRDRMRVTSEMIENAKQQYKAGTEKKRKRTRKNSAPWDSVIEKMVNEGLLTKKISHQAIKKMLKRRWPNYPWDEI